MEPEPFKRIVITPQFLRSAYELPQKHGRAFIKALGLFLADPGDTRFRLVSPAGGAESIQTLQAGKCCRILFSRGRDVKLLFVGIESAAQQFAEHGLAGATAFAEVPIAFQLRIDFWQTGPFAASESPSCGAAISADNLLRLIRRGHKYLPLAQILLSRGPEVGSLELSFREMETTLGAAFPKSARTRSSWWANDPTHYQAIAWLAIGWHATDPDLKKETIAFVRKP